MHPATSIQRGSAFDVRVARDASYQALYEPALLRRCGERFAQEPHPKQIVYDLETGGPREERWW